MTKKLLGGVIFTLVMMTRPALLRAQEFAAPLAAEKGRDESYYPQPVSKPDSGANTRHKAEVRAQQREARLAAQSWYGMTNCRPTASPTPFMTRYSPVWEMPGSRPFSWDPTENASPYVIYRR